ncbi:MAG: hypothetical protein ACJA2S_002126 [Cyclobacteriaceae bacterium]|jgi:hypothetical protein
MSIYSLIKDNSRNYPGWNFTVDKAASKALIMLLDLMGKCQWSTKKIIQTQIPTSSQFDVPNNQHGKARWETKPSLVLNCEQNQSENLWLIQETDSNIEIKFGRKKLKELQIAIKGIPESKGDYEISDFNDQNTLSFWWNLER